jgi:quercetin dioxygenase-like cupin family protein
MERITAATIWALGAVAFCFGVDSINAQEGKGEGRAYSYVTKGVLQLPNVKLLLDEVALGGKELEMAELTFPAGTISDKHQHGSVEIFYVLSGTFGHEVNGKLIWLKPGSVGVVRPGDTVRHSTPKDSEAKVLAIWAPAGEAKIPVPLRCVYPQVATYKGAGDTKQASNFECAEPKS